jgi:cation diffusion facilitator CzcD-associated flavoprotein CzcO
VAIIGAGFGGLGAGIRLRKAALTDFVILERARRVDLAEYTIIPAGARS